MRCGRIAGSDLAAENTFAGRVSAGSLLIAIGMLELVTKSL